MLKLRSSIPAFIALALLAGSVCAQTAPSATPCPDSRTPGTIYRTFSLGQNTSQDNFTEVQTVLRNMLQGARINGVAEQRAIAVCGTPAELELAQKIVSDMDHPQEQERSWKLTYTITHDGSSHVVSLVASPHSVSELKQGTRVPITTGSATESGNGTSLQVQYIDMGLYISAGVESGSPLRVQTKVAQSDTTQEKSTAGGGDPVIGQTVLETTTNLTPGKPLVLGMLTLPGGGNEEVSVTAEPAP